MKIKNIQNKIDFLTEKIQNLKNKERTIIETKQKKCKHNYVFWKYVDNNYDKDYHSGYTCSKCDHEKDRM